MEVITVLSIGQTFRDHCRSFGFKWREGESVLSKNPKLLFNISGGVVFEGIIAAGSPPEIPRVASCQTCLRTDSWNRIGQSGRHHLAFDMLGHFSLYEANEIDTKELMIRTAWNFLIDRINLPSKRLAATVHPQDEVSRTIWEKIGIKKIFLFQDNTHIDPTRTKSGLRTEILWQFQENPALTEDIHSYIELWNLVFTQFEGTKLFEQPMAFIAADSGMSADRAITAVEGHISDYENSRWQSIISRLKTRSQKFSNAEIYRLADMGRAVVVLIAAGLQPGNKAASYTLRKIIREAYLISEVIGLPLDEFSMIVGDYWLDADQRDRIDAVVKTLKDEFSRFEYCLQKGRHICGKILQKQEGTLTADDLSYLAGTYGYPEQLAKKQQAQWDKARS